MKYYDIDGKELTKFVFMHKRDNIILTYGECFCMRTPGGVRLLEDNTYFRVTK